MAVIGPVLGQQPAVPETRNHYVEVVERSFGYDQDLINGVQYFDRYMGYKGVPYFMSIGFVDGEMTIRDKLYRNVRIRYDLYSQVVEIEYENFYGGFSWLLTVADHVKAFQMGEFVFEKLNLDGQSTGFYQVIRTRQFTSYIAWKKRLTPLQNDQRFTHVFSELSSSSFLEMDGAIHPYNNRKELVGLFPEHMRKEINRFLKRNQFNVKGASPNEMVLSMNAVSNLMQSGGLP